MPGTYGSSPSRSVHPATVAQPLPLASFLGPRAALSAASCAGLHAAAHLCRAHRLCLQTGDFATLARAFNSTVAVSGSVTFHDTGIIAIPAGIFPRLEAVGENLMMTQNQGSCVVVCGRPACKQTGVELGDRWQRMCVPLAAQMSAAAAPPGCGGGGELGRLPTGTSSLDTATRVVVMLTLGSTHVCAYMICVLAPPCCTCLTVSAMTSTEGFASLHSIGGELRLASNGNMVSATFAALHQVWHSGSECSRGPCSTIWGRSEMAPALEFRACV